MRVLMLAPWPTVRFLHGGQLRASAIVRAYRARGHSVLCVGLYDANRTDPGSAEPQDYAVPPAIVSHVEPDERNSELASWRALARMPHALAFYEEALRRERPDLLQFEEPYLWPLVQALRARGALDGVPVLHSSYNHETEAKHEIRASGMTVTDQTIRDVAALERDIAAGADAVVVVSDSDAAAYAALGARRVVVAHNGAEPPDAAPDADEALAGYLQGEPFALFVSSAHPPNAQGLTDTAESADVMLRHGSILICGGVAGLLRTMPAFAENQHLFRRARLLGLVDGGLLGAMYRQAAVIILPKTRGGGSNLKTAEALVSGRPIVATRRAFEGFEAYLDAPGVAVEDDATRFWRRVADLLAPDASPQPVLRSPASMRGLLWNACLDPMVDCAERLAPAAGRGRAVASGAGLEPAAP
jgi:glycosyltransferase involved in cell wall biosynthesis